MIIVIGHKNPDTDSVISAKVLANFLGEEATPSIAGEVNRETEFIFSYFKEDLPNIASGEEDAEFFLVDHNEMMQSIVQKEKICGVLDHHMLSGLKTEKPIFFRVEPVGSTSTLVYKMMKEKGVSPTEKEAGLLLGGIISDTLNLNSPTTTTEDIDTYYVLSEISNIEPNSFAEKMFEAKSDFSGKNIEEIISGDLKEFNFDNKRVVIGVAESTSFKYFEDQQEEIKKSLLKIKEERKYDSFFFGAVDIINGNTMFFPASDSEKEVIKNVFEGEEKGNYFLLKDISSRKKEIAPPLSKYYEN
jgi:manganese-dependent inorganic pyrophosphatase